MEGMEGAMGAEGMDAEIDPSMLEGMDASGMESDILDEIMEYAQSKQADGLKSKFAPPAPAAEPEAEEPIPGADAAPEDGEGAAGEISLEDLERLLAE